VNSRAGPTPAATRLISWQSTTIQAYYRAINVSVMTSADSQSGKNEFRNIYIAGIISLIGVVVGGGITGLAAFFCIKMQLDEANKETARKERVAAYTNFFHAANKVDNAFADLQGCISDRPEASRSCTKQISAARESQRLLNGAFEILRVYATDRTLKEAKELKILLELKQIPKDDDDAEAAGKAFPLQHYREVRDRFTLAMCNDLSPRPRQECSSYM